MICSDSLGFFRHLGPPGSPMAHPWRRFRQAVKDGSLRRGAPLVIFGGLLSHVYGTPKYPKMDGFSGGK